MTRRHLVEMVPANARLTEVIALIRRLNLGTVEQRRMTGEILIRLHGVEANMRMTSTRQDAGLRLVSAVRRALRRSRSGK